MEEQSVWSGLLRRCQKNLATDARAAAYLRENGITGLEGAALFRAGVADDGLWESLSKEDRDKLDACGLRALANPSGLLIPTFDPREPERPIGLVRQNYAQNKHAFVTERQGVACGIDCASHARLVLCDAPLLALRRDRCFIPSSGKAIVLHTSRKQRGKRRWESWKKERRADGDC
jgi:hypothetical protein